MPETPLSDGYSYLATTILRVSFVRSLSDQFREAVIWLVQVDTDGRARTNNSIFAWQFIIIIPSDTHLYLIENPIKAEKPDKTKVGK